MVGREENVAGKGSILKTGEDRDLKERQAKNHKVGVTGANFEIRSMLIKSLTTRWKGNRISAWS